MQKSPPPVSQVSLEDNITPHKNSNGKIYLRNTRIITYNMSQDHTTHHTMHNILHIYHLLQIISHILHLIYSSHI